MPKLAKISLLLFFFALCAMAIFATYRSRARTPAPSGEELFAAVDFQLSAFRAADFESAYRHSAAVVQQKFSLRQFETMVRRDFRSMTRPAKIEFGPAHISGGAALVPVFLTAADGSMHQFIYSFSAEPGGWKIDGVESLGEQPERRLRGLRV